MNSEKDSGLDPPAAKPPTTAKTRIEPPDVTDLIKAFRGQRKPDTMHPLTWVRLLDQFDKDIAELRAAYAAARKKLTDQRKDELEPVLEALRAAERTHDRLKKLGKEPDVPVASMKPGMSRQIR